MFCPDLNNNQIRKEFTELSNIVGEDLAYYIYNKQAKEVDGQMTSMLFRTDYNGDANPEFENVLKLKEINNNEVKAIKQMVNAFFIKNKGNEINIKPKIEVKEGVSNVFDENSELSKIGNKQQYSEYLNTIFPESKVKDIVYHLSPNKFETFDKSKIGTNTTFFGQGFYFAHLNRNLIKEQSEGKWEFDLGINRYYSMVDIKTPRKISIEDLEELSKINLDHYDSSITANYVKINDKYVEDFNNFSELVVKEPEQIHILGSKQDIRGFKDFTSESKTNIEFQGYEGGFENTGKGTPLGDGKDKAMRKIANTSIVEIADRSKLSSSLTTEEELPWDSNEAIDGIVMLARNGKLKGSELQNETKNRILESKERGATFVVGDMPNVDSQFIDYLQEIDAKFTIYHTGDNSRIKINSNKIDLLPDSKQLELNFSVTVNDVKETMSKASLTDESTNLYVPETKAKNITQSEYDKLPGKEYLNSFKHVIEYYRSGAEKLVNRYNDATMVETNINGKQAFKVVIYKPRNLVDNLDEGIITKEMPEDVQKSIDRMNNMISAFKLKLAQKTPRYAEIKAQISLLESKISKLEEKYSEGELFKVMKSDEAMIRSNLAKFEEQLSDSDLSSEQLRDVMDALIDTSYYINGWVDVCDFVNTNDIVQEKQIINLQGNIKIHNKKYRDLLADTFARYANSNTFKTDTSREALLAPVADVMRTKANYFSIGESEVLLLQLMDDLISKNASDRNEENIKTTTEVNQWEVNLKKDTGLSKDEIKESFKQKLEDGTWTGNLIGRYKQEFYNKRRSLRDAAKKNKSKWPAFYKWIKENSTEIKESELAKINKTSIEELGDIGIFSKAEVDIQKSLLDQYNKDKLAYVELIATSDIFTSGDLVVNEDGSYKYSNSEEIELEFYEEIEIWKNIHSPFEYIKGDIQFRRQSLGNNYLINEKPSEEWSDPRFKTIKDNEHLYSFYRYIKDTFKEGNKQLPFFNNLQENYLPEKQKRLIERVANNHILAGKWGEISDDLKISMTDNLARPLDEKIAIGSREIKGIRTTMMGDNLDIDQKEDDIFKILTEYNKMVTNYKFKHQIEPMTMAATDIIDGIKDANNTFKPIVNAKDALQYRIDAYLYNYSKDVEGRTGKKVYLTKDKAKLKALKNQLSNEEITKSEFNEAKNKLGREITWSANTDSLITLSYLKQMGLPNFISPTVNLAFGFVSNMTYAAGGKDFSEKEAFKATILLQSLALGNYSHKSKELNKVFAFMDRLGVLGDIHEGNVGEKSFMEYATYLQSHAEKINQGAMMTAMLKTQKLKDKNGKEVKVFDAFKDVNGEIVWDIDKMGEQEKVPMDRIYGENQQGVNLSALSSYMAAVNRKIHGDYKTPMMIKKGAVMRAVMQYKRWIPQAVKHRFGKLDFDQDLLGEDGKRGRTIKGRYRSFVSSSTIDGLELKATESMLIMLKGLALQGKAFKNLSEVDRINMMRNLREIQFIVAMIGSVALLQGMFGDDDDNWALNMAINTLTKTQSDMAFFLNPNAMGQITNNMVPAISTLGDLITVGTYAFKLLYGDVYYQNGPWKDHAKIGVATMRALPFTNGSIKLINYGDRVFNQNY